MRNIILMAAALFCTATAHAADYITFDAFTYHDGHCVRQECDTPRKIGWQHSDLWSDVFGHSLSSDVACGTNSYGRASCSVGGKFEPLHVWDLKAGVFAGLASGYKPEENKVEPLVAGFSVTYTHADFLGQVLFVPKVGNGTQGVVDVWIGVRF